MNSNAVALYTGTGEFLDERVEELTSFFELSPQQWSEIKDCWTSFIQGNSDYPESPAVRAEVAGSWVRSKKLGASLKTLGKLNPAYMNKVVGENRLFLETATPILDKALIFLDKHFPYSPTLTDRNGVVLAQYNRHIAEFDYPGINISEEAVGTTSHSLCVSSGKPVYLVAPENYNTVMQTANFVISVPIHDHKEQVIASFSIPCYQPIEQILKQREWFTWLTTLQFSLANRIEEALRTAVRGHRIDIGRNFLETAASMIEEGVITVNRNGKISHINRGGEAILELEPGKAVGKHYSEVLGVLPGLPDMLSGKEPADKYVSLTRGERNYTLRAEPVWDAAREHIEGAVICLAKKKTAAAAMDKRESLRAIYSFDDILGESAEIVKAKKTAYKIARCPGSVLLTGDSGTGKELFAHAIHNAYQPQSPFVAINCASIPKSLIESELFGYEGGSFTGAERKGRPGKIELANNGTLFLDEIGDMPLDLQPVLLRVLEDKCVMRVGGRRYIPVSFRVIAATNKNLTEMVGKKAFREDLYFRLAALRIQIPPLKTRENDILCLARGFIAEYCRQADLPVPEIKPAVTRKITEYSWPGNIRQLKNAMIFAVSMAENAIIDLYDLPEEVFDSEPSDKHGQVCLSMAEVERKAIEDTLRYTRNNVCEAAELLGMGRTTIYRKLKEYGLDVSLR